MVLAVVRGVADEFYLWTVDNVIDYKMDEKAEINLKLIARFLILNFFIRKDINQVQDLLD
jgi:hypothetical protein